MAEPFAGASGSARSARLRNSGDILDCDRRLLGTARPWGRRGRKRRHAGRDLSPEPFRGEATPPPRAAGGERKPPTFGVLWFVVAAITTVACGIGSVSGYNVS